uniref:RecA family profile 1 domain-containing protein n=1 Tax=Arcella intermedia TaxID=1963864 RepID=A0A6B2L8V4_9EUKA
MVKDENYHKKVPFGCPVLDGMMRGGLPSQGIIELTGEAGSGKTQLALQLLLSTVAPARHGGLEGAAFYVSTEGEFPTRRWSQMLQVYCAEHPEVSPKEMEKNLFIHKVADLSSFWLMLTSKIKLLLRQKPIKVFIIDSVTALFRVDYPLKQCQERARVLTAHAHELLKLSDEFKIPVITVNQVQAFFEEFSGGGPEKSIPALGLAWSTCVNTRIVVARTKRNWNGENVFSPNKKPKTTQTEGTWIRTMSIAWSPYLPPSSCEFIVTNSGVVGIADSSQ